MWLLKRLHPLEKMQLNLVFSLYINHGLIIDKLVLASCKYRDNNSNSNISMHQVYYSKIAQILYKEYHDRVAAMIHCNFHK